MDGAQKRALWNVLQPTTTKSYGHCVAFTLPSAGVIAIKPDFTVTLTADAVFTPQCTSAVKAQDASDGISSIADMRDPFHASITPQAYATGAATVIAWMLVIMLVITPRTFFVGGAVNQSGLLGRRGMISGATGGGSVIGVGSRPWLQKVAALTVAISLTLATADTFKIAKRQYEGGYMNAMALRDEVVGGMEIKVSRIISDVFLWLAQVQTLIRLFPRHKEKVIIKWTGFALIMLDIIFSCMNSFMGHSTGRPRKFVDAIPALSYLFQLALSMLYAAWVMYYSVTKRRYAFYHSMMWNMTLISLLSIIAILTPVVFFITDICNDSVAGWGDYFRWVGAAAASVIVWEWVERIEALEREERKDGILGREIYDGDEMLDATPSQEVTWPRSWQSGLGNGKDPGDGKDSGHASGSNSHGFGNLAHRFVRSRQNPNAERHIRVPLGRAHTQPTIAQTQTQTNAEPATQFLTPPPNVASPVSRTDTASADSTVYTIRYHPISDSPPIVRQSTVPQRRTTGLDGVQQDQSSRPSSAGHDLEKAATDEPQPIPKRSRFNWQAVPNPFSRRKASPPPEVQRGTVIESFGIGAEPSNVPAHNYSKWALKARVGAFAAEQAEKIREKTNGRQVDELNLPVTIIPAQPRGRTWSPELLQQQNPRLEGTIGEPPRSGPSNFSSANGNTLSPSSHTFVDDMSSPQGSGNDGRPDVGSSNGNSRIRFTPETWQRPTTRQMNDLSPVQRLPTVVSLGTEQVDDRPSPSRPSPSPGPSRGRA